MDYTVLTKFAEITLIATKVTFLKPLGKCFLLVQNHH